MSLKKSRKMFDHFTANTILTQLKNQSIMLYFVESFGYIKEYPMNFEPNTKRT